jgi:hypothetical protein
MKGEPKMRWPSAALLAPLLLSGCIATTNDPWNRDGAWRSSGANDANLRAMIADPPHLSRGAQAPTAARGEAAALATGRLAFPSTPTQGQSTGPGVPNLPPLRTGNVGQ